MNISAQSNCTGGGPLNSCLTSVSNGASVLGDRDATLPAADEPEKLHCTFDREH